MFIDHRDHFQTMRPLQVRSALTHDDRSSRANLPLVTRSYDCLVSMKMEKLLDVLHQASYGAYVIVKLLAKNRASFVKVILC